ncbi:hypothetical protein LX36DRAFT_663611 [Colletotrichum falcatum]|nr:hypothetical protein LX36DRAFT_663611 [Colletotrichum falcatum]
MPHFLNLTSWKFLVVALTVSGNVSHLLGALGSHGLDDVKRVFRKEPLCIYSAAV